MKTPAEFEPLGYFLEWGVITVNGVNYWTNHNGVVLYEVLDKTSLTDAEAVEALRKLSKEDHRKYILEGHPDTDEHHCSIADLDADPFVFYDSGWQPTISAAVEEALLKLLAAESKEEE